MDKQAAIERLKEDVQPGDTLHMFVTDVARSGMSRSIKVYRFSVLEDGRIDAQWLSYLIALALEMRFDEKRESVRIGGTGMDMGFALVDALSNLLFERSSAIRHEWL
jgi:hypothetical protein